jgi:hypothetical protein
MYIFYLNFRSDSKSLLFLLSIYYLIEKYMTVLILRLSDFFRNSS